MESNILTKDQIGKLTGLNTEAIKFYLVLANQRLEDTLSIKRELEQKAFILFAGYIAAAFALFGLAERSDGLSYWLIGSALFFCAGVVMLFVVINIEKYGVLGRNPEDWLDRQDYLTIKDKHIGHMYAYVLYDLIDDIEMSKRSNSSKVFYLSVAIALGLLSLSPLVIWAVFA
ncbi:hypothetical protein Nit79A3_2427 [Nitrosomonas sp. Is79A3]|uniref:hypothetical protein n=1 Tax=Nitrosomonas sp. (strain Is79A3) TaxID=261292 RepID=UPI000215CADA